MTHPVDDDGESDPARSPGDLVRTTGRFMFALFSLFSLRLICLVVDVLILLIFDRLLVCRRPRTKREKLFAILSRVPSCWTDFLPRL